MNDNEFDVVVVGAGCAGPAAAKKAAEFGLKVLLLEKSQSPGDKNVSGTCLNMAGLIDPDLNYLMKGPIEREITEMSSYMITPELTTYINEKPATGLILLSIRRDHFDVWQTEEAKKAGAIVKLSTTVMDIIEEGGRIKGVITDSGEKYYGKVIIDAAGVNSIVGRKAGLIPKRTGKDNILYVTVAVELGEKLVTERFGNSIYYFLAPGAQYKTWPWAFPKKDTVTLGTGGYMDGSLFKGDITNVGQYMQNLMDLPSLKEKLEGGKIVATGIHLEFDEAIEKRTRDGLILAGEAGGFVIPFLGEGMVESFFTGIYAAEAAEKAIKENNFSAEFLEENFIERYEGNTFLQSFRYVADMNKKSILERPDVEIANMMQNVVIGGGFISNCIHHNWMKGAEEGDLDLVQEAKDFYDFIQPYRDVGSESIELYKKMRSER
jgi:electron transfer flavoprotein-quinone oxidoreductase